MLSKNKLAEDGDRLPFSWQLNQSGIGPARDVWVWFTHIKRAHMKKRRIQAANDFARICHLRVLESLIGETVHQNTNRLHTHLKLSRLALTGNAAMLIGNPHKGILTDELAHSS